MKKENIVLAINSDVSKENNEKIEKSKAEEVVGDVKELSSGGEIFNDPQEVEKAKAAHNVYSGNGRVDIFDPTPVVEKYDTVYPSSYFLEKVGSGDADKMREFEDYEVIEGVEYAYPGETVGESVNVIGTRIAVLIGDGKVEEFYRYVRDNWEDEAKFVLGDAVTNGEDVKAVSFARVAKEKGIKPGKEGDWINDPYANYVVFGRVNERFLKLEDNLKYLKKIQSYPEDIELTATAKDVPILELGATNGSEVELVKQVGTEDVEMEGAIRTRKSHIFFKMDNYYKEDPFKNQEDEDFIVGYGKKFVECIPEQEKTAWMYPVICGDDELSNHKAFYLYERVSYLHHYVENLKEEAEAHGLKDDMSTSFYGALSVNLEKTRRTPLIRINLEEKAKTLNKIIEFNASVNNEEEHYLPVSIEEFKQALSFLTIFFLFDSEFFERQYIDFQGDEQQAEYLIKEELKREIEEEIQNKRELLEREGLVLNEDIATYVLNNYEHIMYLLTDFYIKTEENYRVGGYAERYVDEIAHNTYTSENIEDFLKNSGSDFEDLIEKVLVPLGLIKR